MGVDAIEMKIDEVFSLIAGLLARNFKFGPECRCDTTLYAESRINRQYVGTTSFEMPGSWTGERKASAICLIDLSTTLTASDNIVTLS